MCTSHLPHLPVVTRVARAITADEQGSTKWASTSLGLGGSSTNFSSFGAGDLGEVCRGAAEVEIRLQVTAEQEHSVATLHAHALHMRLGA